MPEMQRSLNLSSSLPVFPCFFLLLCPDIMKLENANYGERNVMAVRGLQAGPSEFMDFYHMRRDKFSKSQTCQGWRILILVMSSMMDSFHAVDQVLRWAPENFELLSRVLLRHEYMGNVGGCHNHMIGVGPVINVYPWNNELYLIRYNNYDRAVINTVPHDVVCRWYHAHCALTTDLRQPENELWVKLKPGKALFVDNWHVLHGREVFMGYQQLCGF